nr:nuclear transport factor 2 family protein [Rhodococcus sp. P14]
MRATVTAYLSAVANGTADEITALYAPDATVEDPAGSEPKVGHEAIRAFYRAVENTRNETELLTLRITDAGAAFHFRVVTETDGQRYEIEPIDVMTFDENGLITSMRAFWAPADMRQN